MIKNTFLLLTCVTAMSVHAENDFNQLLVKYCGQANHNTSQSVTIEQVTAIGYHRNGYLKIEQDVNDKALRLALAKRAEKVGVDSQCMEYLDAMRLLSINASSEKELIARVYFDFDRHILTPESILILDKVVNRLKMNSDVIELTGHTDSTGDKDYNRRLGMQRSVATKQYLVDKGMTDKNVELASEGEDNPLEDNNSTDGRKKNRRVEIF